MKAIVVEGGAMRGVFASGVLDTFLYENYNPFDFAIGVSAGASNLISYLSEQPGRNFDIISNLATTSRFFNPIRFLKGGDLIDVKWLVEYSDIYYPINQNNIFKNIPLIIVVTCIETGTAHYLKLDKDNLFNLIEATSALPIVYHGQPKLLNKVFIDGGIVDSIPIYSAYKKGARDITVILSHPIGYKKKEIKRKELIKSLFLKKSKIADALFNRVEIYNQSLEFIKNPPKGITVRVIAPPNNFKVQRFTRNNKLLREGYKMGLIAGKEYLRINC